MTKIILVFFFFFLLSVCVLCKVPPNTGSIQLLDFGSNENNTVKLVDGAVEHLFLNPLVSDRDVVVVSIAGAFRKGKSFLLNYMLRYLYANYRSIEQPEEVANRTESSDWLGSPDEPLEGFAWKSSTKRETTGIIFWSDVFLYDAPNGARIAIYLMDTQGLFDHSSSPTDNIRIFSLSALVSSVQLMNIYVMIEESHLEYLQFATEIAKFTAVESDSNSKPFQRLMFLIRDWSSPDEYDYGLEGGNRFMQSFLKIKDFHTAELKTVRQYIMNTFETINCFLMPYPGKIVARNSTFDGRWSVIDEDFVETMKELFPTILSPPNLTIKTINGVAIKSFELSVYIKQYVNLFKSENMPEAKSIYESTLDNQFQILMSKAVELYLQSISLYQDRIKNKTEVDQLHGVAKGLALKYFNEEKKFGNQEDGQVYLKELDDKLENALSEWKPVTLNSLEKIQKEQAKAEVHRKTATEAEHRSEIAKKEAKVADERYVELEKQVAQARYDTEDARRAAALIKKQLDQADQERQAATLKEAEARKKYNEMHHKIARLEAQIITDREFTAKQINQRVHEVRHRDGVSKWFGPKVNAVVIYFFEIIGSQISKVLGL